MVLDTCSKTKMQVDRTFIKVGDTQSFFKIALASNKPKQNRPEYSHLFDMIHTEIIYVSTQ